jgi:hypothetical protein
MRWNPFRRKRSVSGSIPSSYWTPEQLTEEQVVELHWTEVLMAWRNGQLHDLMNGTGHAIPKPVAGHDFLEKRRGVMRPTFYPDHQRYRS